MLRDPQLIHEVALECTETFKWLLSNEKPAVKEILENLMAVIVTDPKTGKESLLKLNKVNNIFKHIFKINLQLGRRTC